MTELRGEAANKKQTNKQNYKYKKRGLKTLDEQDQKTSNIKIRKIVKKEKVG